MLQNILVGRIYGKNAEGLSKEAIISKFVEEKGTIFEQLVKFMKFYSIMGFCRDIFLVCDMSTKK